MRLLQVFILTIGIFFSSGIRAQDGKEIQWLTFEELNDSLAINPKPVLIFLHTDWCVYCKKMQKETFRDAGVVDLIQKGYYAVSFDAEHVDTVFFDSVHYTNAVKKKKAGHYHTLAKILIGEKRKVVFPITLLFNRDFQLIYRKEEYLSIQQISKIL